MILVLVGPPGAGKGTQADLLVSKNGYRKLSTGDALRKHIKNKTKIGEVAASIMERGELVPDDILFKILEEELGENKEEVVLLDGYPRNVEQAKTLETIGSRNPIVGAVHIDVKRELLLNRLTGRRTCPNCTATFHVVANPPKRDGICDKCEESLVHRPDDTKDKVSVRLDVYDNTTMPVLEFYKERNLYHVADGTGTSDEVFQRLDCLARGLTNSESNNIS